MYNFLSTVDPAASASLRRDYWHYLIERDGDLDATTRTLSRREAQMHRFENVEPLHELDPALFDAQYGKFDPSRPTSKEMLLVLSLCKLNAAEAYGVEASMRVAEELARKNDHDDIEMRVLVEEHYHTRLLQSSAREYGIRVSQTFQPPLSLRGLIGGVTSMPLSITRPLVLASEIVGTLMFAQAFVRAGEILAHDPALRDRIQERIVEILIDELGHVAFNQIHLGTWGMFQARRLLPLVATGMRDLFPELGLIGMRTTTDMTWLDRLPREVMDRAFVVRETSAYAGRARAAAAAE